MVGMGDGKRIEPASETAVRTARAAERTSALMEPRLSRPERVRRTAVISGAAERERGAGTLRLAVIICAGKRGRESERQSRRLADYAGLDCTYHAKFGHSHRHELERISSLEPKAKDGRAAVIRHGHIPQVAQRSDLQLMMLTQSVLDRYELSETGDGD